MNKLTIGLDTAKSVFHLVFKNENGLVVKKKKLKRHQLLSFFANIDVAIVAFEACGASHYWARKILALGHDVRPIPPQHVAPYRKGNKSDYNDATAIAEASSRDDMRFVPIKSQEQQDPRDASNYGCAIHLEVQQKLKPEDPAQHAHKDIVTCG